MALHEDEIPVDETVVRSLLTAQRPEWAHLPLSPAGAGTDNTLYRLGDDLLVRLPRTADKGRSVRKEQEWLPRLAPFLACPIPGPVHAGTPTNDFPLVWSVYRWIDGEEAGPDTVQDWSAFGADLAAVVRGLHGTDLMGPTRADDLSWYRGGSLGPCDPWVSRCLDDCRTTVGAELDVDLLEQLWRSALTPAEPSGPHVWLHGGL
uniref:phosphotransferase n=1 Tax=Streptomyces sp. CC219B TaxID=3044574 RepID=UPI0024A8F929